MSKAANLIKEDNKQEDWIAVGFHKLDDNIIEKRPPKIKWGVIYRNMDDNEKIRYLENLASVMNHAAFIIQNERNQLGELCEKKEEQIKALNKRANDASLMLQHEITRMNEKTQGYHSDIAKLNQKIRDLESGNLN